MDKKRLLAKKPPANKNVPKLGSRRKSVARTKSQGNEFMPDKTKQLLQKICYKKTASVDMTQYGFIVDCKIPIDLQLKPLRERLEQLRCNGRMVKSKKTVKRQCPKSLRAVPQTSNGGNNENNLLNKNTSLEETARMVCNIVADRLIKRV